MTKEVVCVFCFVFRKGMQQKMQLKVLSVKHLQLDLCMKSAVYTKFDLNVKFIQFANYFWLR